ncbi:hypothetical protein A2U01_0031333, partial [Trifolium medium]|nr:hypothetical protein [Trifolium medium]
DEIDQRERSSKKVKNNDLNFKSTTGTASIPTVDSEGTRVDDKVEKSLSYKETVLGAQGENQSTGATEVWEVNEEDDGDSSVEGTIEEQKVGEVDCPIFKFSVKEEQRIQRPWKQGVIVQLLGRKIGYKALETRLKQMWSNE